MCEQEQNEIVGASFNRFKAAKRQVQCLRSKLSRIGSDYGRTAKALNNARKPYIRDGEVFTADHTNFSPSVRVWDGQDLVDTLAAYHAAVAELSEAETDWAAHQAC